MTATAAEQGFTFGDTVASDYVPMDSDAVWIRYFKDPITTIRLIPFERPDAAGIMQHGVEAWLTEREHYDPAIKMSYPCVERFGAECKGCASNQEKVRERKRCYYFPAYDDKGEQRVFKCGPAVYKILKARQARKISQDPNDLQPLSSTDLVISKSGKGLETQYDIEAGDKYQIDWPDELLDIPAALADSYNDAMAAYAQPAAAAANKAAATREAAATPAEKESPLAKAAASKTSAAAEAEESGLGDKPRMADFDDASVPDIRAWLNSKEIEFPANAPRSRLTKLAEAWLKANDGPDF